MQIQTLERTINAWDCIGKHPKTIMFIGLSHTGKTTFAELVNKYQHGIKQPTLIFEKDKYARQNVISPKSIKIQTVLPSLYRKEGSAKDDLSIVDVPCYCLTPELKKWSLFDQKLTINLMLQHCEKVGFLLFIEQKNTRTNPNLWKKTFSGFFEMFKEFPEELLQSVGWVITKCPPELNEEAISKRLMKLQEAMKAEKPADGGMIDKLFENILTNNRYFIFRKTTGNEEAEGEEIRRIYQKLGEICNYRSVREYIKDSSWNAEEEGLLQKYLQRCDEQLSNFLKAIRLAINKMSEKQPFSQELLDQVRKQFLPNEIGQGKINESVLAEFADKRRQFKVEQFLPEFIKAFTEILQMVTKQSNKQSALKFINFNKFPICLNQPEDRALFQFIQEAINLKNTANLKFEFDATANMLEEIFSKNKGVFIKKLMEIASSDLKDGAQAFLQATIDLLESDSTLSTEFSEFLSQCQENIAKFKNPKKLIEKLMQQLDTSDYQKQVEVAYKIAKTAEKEKIIKSASKIYKKLQCPGDILRCSSILVPQSEDQAKQFINYLIELSLFEAAKKKCYEYCSQFGIRSKRSFGQLLSKVMQNEREYMKLSRSTNVLLGQLVLQRRDWEQIKAETAVVLGQLKDI